MSSFVSKHTELLHNMGEEIHSVSKPKQALRQRVRKVIRDEQNKETPKQLVFRPSAVIDVIRRRKLTTGQQS